MRRALLISIIGVFIFLGFYEQCSAIPAFARKYRLSCQTCHLPTPRLKPYGDDFAGNGFVLSDQEAPRYFVETGDDNLSLIRDFPLAVRFDGFLTYNNSDTEKSDLGSPYTLKILSGGSITEGIAYYFYFYMSERGEIAGVEDAYIMFNDLFGVDFDIYFGQFQVSDPLFKRELRLTLEDYSVYTMQPGISQAGLKYDRGFMFTFGTDFGMDIIAEVINGNGLSHADASHIFDNDKYKNFAGRISQNVFDFLRIGVFGYLGKEQLSVETASALNEITMYGPDATISCEDIIELNFQYIIRKDNNLLNIDGDNFKDIETHGALAELLIMPKGDDTKLYGAAMLNYVQSDLGYLDYQTVTGHIGYLVRRNIRLCAEATYNFTDSDKAFAKFSLGIVSGF